jgi:PAS domain S-box-containing protein
LAILERVHAADRAATYTAFRNMFEGTVPLDHRCRLQRRDGRFEWFEFVATEIERKHVSVRVIGILRPTKCPQHAGGSVADHVQAMIQSESAKSARLREDLYEHAPDMIISVCAGTGKILDCNQTICEKTGFSRAELVGRPVIEMYSPSCWSQAKDASEAFLRTGHIENINLEVRRKGGGVIEVNVNVSAIRAANGMITATRAVWRDVTEIRNDEREQRQKETKLAHVMRIATLGELATGIAHEVNQPLASIAAFASGILHLFGNYEPSDEIANAVVKIRDEADRAGAIIRRMREFVRQGGARIELVAIKDLIQGIVPLLYTGGRRIHVKISCVEVCVPCDPIQIQQVLLNLIKNADDAITAAPPAVPEIEVQVRERTDFVEVRVIDNAATDFSTNSDKFFESFFTTKSDGIGLGLPLSRSFIEAHGGKLWFEPNPKGGASFLFTIPLTDGSLEQISESLESEKI